VPRGEDAARLCDHDIAEVNLPFLVEPMTPALGKYQHEYARVQ